MKPYRIKRQHNPGERYYTLIISNRETGEQIAEYRLTPGRGQAEIAAMRRTIDRHLAGGWGATLGNFQW